MVDANIVILYPPAGTLSRHSRALRRVGELLNNETVDENIFGLARDRRLRPCNFDGPFPRIIGDPNGIRVIVLEKPTGASSSRVSTRHSWRLS